MSSSGWPIPARPSPMASSSGSSTRSSRPATTGRGSASRSAPGSRTRTTGSFRSRTCRAAAWRSRSSCPRSRSTMTDKSLSEVHETVAIPQKTGTIRRLFAFAGPAYLVSVGYMDPGNWATDIAAGSRYGYALLWVLVMSNAMAVLLQGLSARLGLVSGRDLAQACRDRYHPPVNAALWILCEVAIAACDLAEVIGSAIGLQLLFGIPLVYGVVVTALDTFLILFLHHAGIRKMEAFIVVLVATIGGCFLVEIVITRPDAAAIVRGFVPTLPDSSAL